MLPNPPVSEIPLPSTLNGGEVASPIFTHLKSTALSLEEQRKAKKKARDAARYWANRERILGRNKTYMAAYRAANQEKIRATTAAYYAANKEKCRAYKAAYRAANPEKIRASKAAYQKANREKARTYRAAYYAANPKKCLAYQAAYQKANREKVRASKAAYRVANPEKIRAYKAAHYAANREKILTHQSEYERHRSKTDSLYRLTKNLRRRLSLAFKSQGVEKTHATFKLTGCSKEELRQHLVSQFREGMTLENHGKVWHIDHIRPCASFDLSDPNQATLCFHYSNLQPLFADENIRKGDRWKP